MNKNISYLSILLLMVLMINPTTVFAYSNVDIGIQNSREDLLISELIMTRASLFNNTTKVDIHELNKIDSQLYSLGCEFLTTAEVDEKFPEGKSERVDVLSEMTKNTSGGIQNVSPPSQNNVSWINHPRSTYTYNGNVYNVQLLVATPNQLNSNLKNIGTRSVQYSHNYQLAWENLIKSIATTSLGAIPGSSTILALYDALTSTISGLSRTSEVNTPHISYTYSNVTTVCFSYVRLESQSDDYQQLSLISSGTETTIQTSVPGFSYKVNNSGQWIANSSVLSKTQTFYAVPNSFFSVYAAVKAYNNGQTRDCITRIQISGPEDKHVQYIYPVSPQFPAHIY